MGVGVGGVWGFKALLQLANFTLGPDATLYTEIQTVEEFSLYEYVIQETPGTGPFFYPRAII